MRRQSENCQQLKATSHRAEQKTGRFTVLSSAVALCAVTAIAIISNDASASDMKETHVITESYVIRKGLMHPVNYWWEMSPSSSGTWDYFTPVEFAYEPVPIETKVPIKVASPRPMIVQKPDIIIKPQQMIMAPPVVYSAPIGYQQPMMGRQMMARPMMAQQPMMARPMMNQPMRVQTGNAMPTMGYRPRAPQAGYQTRAPQAGYQTRAPQAGYQTRAPQASSYQQGVTNRNTPYGQVPQQRQSAAPQPVQNQIMALNALPERAPLRAHSWGAPRQQAVATPYDSYPPVPVPPEK